MTYCAFVVCALLDDWSSIDLPRALSYIHRCRVASLPPSFAFAADVDITVVRGRIRADATRRSARWANLLRTRSATPHPNCARSTARRVARDGALAGTDADAGRARGRLCGAHKQAAGRVLRFLVQCRALRTSHPSHPPTSFFVYLNPLYMCVVGFRRLSAQASCSMRMRSARFLRNVSSSLVGSARRQENTPVSKQASVLCTLAYLCVVCNTKTRTIRICQSRLRRSYRRTRSGSFSRWTH